MKSITLLFLFSVYASFSQTFTGKVLEKGTNKPLESVNVLIEKERIGAVTNEKGEFNLVLSSKTKPTDTVRFSSIGYQTKQIIVSELKQVNFIIHLSEKIENLGQVTVSQKRQLENKIPFVKLSPQKKGVYNFGSELVDNKIYVIGGDQSFIEDSEKKAMAEVSNIPNPTLEDLLKKIKSNYTWEEYSGKLQIYDIENDNWAVSNLEFIKRAYHKVIYLKNKLFVIGGKTISKNKKFEFLDNKIETLNLETNQIIIDNTNPHQAINFAAVTYQDNIIVMGGSIKLKKNGEKVYSNKSHIFNTTSGYWYELPEMPKAKEVNGIIVENKVYLIGGFNKEPLSEIESFNLNNGKWKKEGNLFSGIEYPSLSYSNSIIYIFSNGKILTYNTATKILNEYKIGLYTKGSQMYCYNGLLYIIGGFKEDDYRKSSSSNLYLINLNDFSKTKIMNSTKFN